MRAMAARGRIVLRLPERAYARHGTSIATGLILDDRGGDGAPVPDVACAETLADAARLAADEGSDRQLDAEWRASRSQRRRRRGAVQTDFFCESGAGNDADRWLQAAVRIVSASASSSTSRRSRVTHRLQRNRTSGRHRGGPIYPRGFALGSRLGLSGIGI